MKTQAEIQNRIDFYRTQWEMSVKENLWTAAAIYDAQISALEWSIS